MEAVIWSSEPKIWDIKNLWSLEPQRNVGNGKGNSGQFHSTKLNRNVSFESGLEYKFAQKLERLDNVIYYLEQPFSLEYKYENETRSYHPDFFFLLEDGRGVVVEIKPIFQMGLHINLVKWKALREYCTKKGLGIIVSNGRKSIQSVQSFHVREAVREAVFQKLQQSCLSWAEYQNIRDTFEIGRNEFIALILQSKLYWQLSPFILCFPKSE